MRSQAKHLVSIIFLFSVCTCTGYASEKLILPFELALPDNNKYTVVAVIPKYRSELFYPTNNTVDRLLVSMGQRRGQKSQLAMDEEVILNILFNTLKNVYIEEGQVRDNAEDLEYLRQVVWAKNSSYVIINRYNDLLQPLAILRIESALENEPLGIQPYLSQLGIDSTKLQSRENLRLKQQSQDFVEWNPGDGRLELNSIENIPTHQVISAGALGTIMNLFHKPEGDIDLLPFAWMIAESLGITRKSGMTHATQPPADNMKAAMIGLIEVLRKAEFFPEPFFKSLLNQDGSVNWSRIGLEFSGFYTEAHGKSLKAYQKLNGAKFFDKIFSMMDSKTGLPLNSKIPIFIGEIDRQTLLDKFGSNLRKRYAHEDLNKIVLNMTEDHTISMLAQCVVLKRMATENQN